MKVRELMLWLPLTFFLLQADAQEARFFRIGGPVSVTITGFSADGYITWTNSQTNATFVVQTTSTLAGETGWVDFIRVFATNQITTHRIVDPNPPERMGLVPEGSFFMGNGALASDGWPHELPVRSVSISAFYMDQLEVTKALWDDVCNWATNRGYRFDSAGSGKSPDHPVQTISWYDCLKWCNARSEKEGRSTAYFTDAGHTNVYREGQLDILNDCVVWNSGYRLPTEAEWEKAARGGVNGNRFPWSSPNMISWVLANYQTPDDFVLPYDANVTPGFHPTFAMGGEPYTSPVGFFKGNNYGLYDMAGNVQEWCWDRYALYPGDSEQDPHGPMEYHFHVYRGGGWSQYAFNCRASARDVNDPSYQAYDLGFRCVLPTP